MGAKGKGQTHTRCPWGRTRCARGMRCDPAAVSTIEPEQPHYGPEYPEMRFREGIDAAWCCHKRAWTIYWSCWPAIICVAILGQFDAGRNGPLAWAGGIFIMLVFLTFFGLKFYLWSICSRENQHTLATLLLLMAPWLVFVTLAPWIIVIHLLRTF